jgi:alkyl hydroperoxide reductase subunit F
MNSQYELIIIGGGPAGVAAAVYAGRKKIKTLLITNDFGGQSVVSEDIQNWIGDAHISGMELAHKFKNHVKSYMGEDLQIKSSVTVTNIEKDEAGFVTALSSGETVKSKTVLVATGSKRRQLPALNADKFEHKGLTYCASCDGLFFAGKDVVVAGAGNAAFESALQLAAYCKSVTIFARSSNYRADEVTVSAVKNNSKITILEGVEIQEVLGDKVVSGIRYKDLQNGEEKELSTEGIFVEIGQIPNTDFAKNICQIDSIDRIEIDPWTQKTSTTGLWAAGDCTNVRYHQNNIAAGNGVTALEDIYQYLQTIK